MADKFIYYRHADGRLIRIRADFWQKDGSVEQRIWSGATRMWEPTSGFAELMAREEPIENLMDCNPHWEFDSPNFTYGHRFPRSIRDLCKSLPDLHSRTRLNLFCSTLELERYLGKILENFRTSTRGWVALISAIEAYSFLIYVAASPAGLWLEFIDTDIDFDDEGSSYEIDCTSESQREILPLLGWNWPSPPEMPYWHYHDEILGSAFEVSRIVLRTLWQICECRDYSNLNLRIYPQF